MPKVHWKWKRHHVVALCFLMFSVGVWLGWEAHEFISIDDCLDRSGAWDYRRSNCDF